MGDEDDRREFIKSNLTVLSETTVIGTPLVLRLYEKGLIDVEEKHILSNTNIPGITRAMTLYTSTADKWDHNHFLEFKNILQDLGNSKALQVFTNDGADCFLTNEEVQLLRQQGNKSEDGCYEGLAIDEEKIANKIVQYARSDKMFAEGRFRLSPDLERREVVRLVRRFSESLKNKTIWWNPRKQQLPLNCIQRRVSRAAPRAHIVRYYGTSHSRAKPKTLLEVIEDLVLLVDPPGMGKSSEVTNLERQLRTEMSSNRIILRINLNEVQEALSSISENETAPNVIPKLAPFLPSMSLLIPGVRLVVLLDGLDEVCPKHQDTMINLLRILKSKDDLRDLTVVVTSRPHLRKLLESKFNLNSWSLLPLTNEQQDGYMRAVGVSEEELSTMRGTLTPSIKHLLSNPLMLFMFVDLMKCGGSLSASDLNIYDLYSRFVEAKHELHCVEKLGMKAKTNYADIVRDSLLNKNLPFYYHVALSEFNIKHYARLPGYIKSIGSVVKEPLPTTTDSIVTAELLSYGLLIENYRNELVFKHRSFAEFFYARLLTQEESTSQVVRDTLFGCIYSRSGTMINVEAFVGAALSKIATASLSLNITTKWMLIEKSRNERNKLLQKFVKGKLFSLCAPMVLLAFVNGDPRDLLEAFRVLLDVDSRESFVKFFDWMCEEREWVRRELFKISVDHEPPDYPPPSAMLAVAIAVNFESQELLSVEEVGRAIRSPYNRLIYTVACTKTDVQWKWDFVEGHLEEGHLRELFLKADNTDFHRIVEDKETAWKLVANLSEEEIYALVTKQETRVTDVGGRKPDIVFSVLGDNFISGLAEFRGKFDDDKGKTVFELSDGEVEFVLDLLWADLLKEKELGILDGPVRVALREAFGRSSTDLLEKLGDAVRRKRRCERRSTDFSLLKREWEESDGVLDWTFRGTPFWEPSSVLSSEFLPFVVRYCRDTNLIVTSILQLSRNKLCHDTTMIAVMRSLILSTSSKGDYNSACFFQLISFLQELLQQNRIPEKWRYVVGVFVGASMEEVRAATPISPHSRFAPFDVSVGEVFIRLIKQFTYSALKYNMWTLIVRDVIQFTPCCKICSVLEELMDKSRSTVQLDSELKNKCVLYQWEVRFSPRRRRKEADCDMCGLSQLLSFYFSVFGLNLDWMMEDANENFPVWDLVKELPVEIVGALENNFHWIHLLPHFRQILRGEVVPYIPDIGSLLDRFHYRTDGDWERLLRFTGWEERHTPTLKERSMTPCFRAAPLVRVLLKMFGENVAKVKVSPLWGQIPCYGGSSELLGFLLHTAIELGELAEVQKRALPGLLSWRSPQGKEALQVAMETWGTTHPITLHLHSRVLSRQSPQVPNCT